VARSARHALPSDSPLSFRSLLELSFYSALIFVFAALCVQFLLTLITASLLNVFSITYQYSLFAINYSSEGGPKWSDEQIYVIFGLGPLILTALGFLGMFILTRFKKAHWKTKLALTWLTFILINAIPCSFLAGVFFYDGFGVTLHWLIGSLFGRGLVALLALAILIVFSRFWQRMFLKTACTNAFLETGEHQKTYIVNVFFKPWIYGLIILLLFNWQFTNLFWRAFLLSFGFMAIALFDHRARMHRKPHILKSGKRIFTSRWQPVFFVMILVFIWIVDYIIIIL
jgi:hypothetical protein